MIKLKTLNKVWLSFSIAGMLITIPFSSFSFNYAQTTESKINKFYSKTFKGIMKLSPQTVSESGLNDILKLRSNEQSLNDISPKSIDYQKKLSIEWLKNNKKIDGKKLHGKDLLNSEIFSWYMNDSSKLLNMSDYEYVLNQFSGVQMELPVFMINYHKINNLSDAKNYITRLSKFKNVFEGALQRMKRSKSKGIVPPVAVLESAIDQMESFIIEKPKDNMLYTEYVKKVSKLKADKKLKSNLYEKAAKVIKQTVYPEYKKLISYCKKLSSKPSKKIGLCSIKGGDKYYAQLVKHYSTTDMTPEQIYNMGSKWVSETEKELRTLLTQSGISGTSLSDCLSKARIKFSTSAQTAYKANKHNDYTHFLINANKMMVNLCDLAPVKIPEVKKMSDIESQGTAPHYVPASLDGSRNGTFYIYDSPLDEFLVEDLSFHEGIPGHHFQFSIQQSLKDVPLFRKLVPFGAYIEGWASYAERLAYENDLFSSTYDKIRFLEQQLNIAIAIVLDTGIHYKHWSTDKALTYLSPFGVTSAGAVLRMEAIPGQAISYGVGEMKILQLREEAKKKLGNKFNIKEFHDTILKNGSLPLGILDKQVKQYIASKLSHKKAH